MDNMIVEPLNHSNLFLNKVVFSFDKPNKKISKQIIFRVLKGYKIPFEYVYGYSNNQPENYLIADVKHISKIKELCFVNYKQDSLFYCIKTGIILIEKEIIQDSYNIADQLKYTELLAFMRPVSQVEAVRSGEFKRFKETYYLIK